jgi:hypothetical protein
MLNTPLAVLLATTIILCPVTSSSSSQLRLTYPQQRLSSHELTDKMLKCMVKYGKIFGVKPEVILAVAKWEGQDLKDGIIRVGPIGQGTYVAPMGIYWGFGVAPYNWNIYDPETNVMVGARVLHGNLLKRLKKYNTKYTSGYGNGIIALARQYEDAKVFSRNDNGVMFKYSLAHYAATKKRK